MNIANVLMNKNRLINCQFFVVASLAWAFSSTLLLGGCDRHHEQLSKASTNPASTSTDSQIAEGAGARLAAQPVPLSAMAQLGKKIFFDPSLSASGKISCAFCHNPEYYYAPSNELAVQLGGSDIKLQGGRAVPSLTYHEHAPPFSIGPDLIPDNDDQVAVAQQNAKQISHAKVASFVKADIVPGSTIAANVEKTVPQGGMDWDGRAASLLVQAGGPFLAPNEMANRSPAALMSKLKVAPYANDMKQLFGPGVFINSPNSALGEAYFALARFQIEDRSFHLYNSKFDYFLAGKVQLSAQELLGKKLFDDPKKGNCATCHPDKPSKDGRFAPSFTDYQFEALGAPRNMAISANRDLHFYDEGLCGPLRKDMTKQQNYCGLFKTPSLRNSATRHVFFHNGVFHSLEDVVRFYVERETKPENWYPRAAGGEVVMYNDLPRAHRVNVDLTDAPFDRKHGDAPALASDEVRDVVAFLKTLTDGYQLDATTTLGNTP
jgi:cytochrome c peroxidase